MAYLTAKQAAEKLSVNIDTLYQLVKAGTIPAVKLSARMIRIREEDLNPENLPSAQEA